MVRTVLQSIAELFSHWKPL